MSEDFKKLRITVDPHSGMPLWLQLRNRLVYLIESGGFAEGEKLPTVRELAVDLGINYNTVSKVYQDIERDGYIVSKRGKGTFVAPRVHKEEAPAKSELEILADEFIRSCAEHGMSGVDITTLVASRVELLDK